MTTTLPKMGLALPTRGPSGAGTWDDTLDADLTTLDGHDHTSGNGAQVPSAGVNINADLTFNSLWAPIALNRLSFASVAAPTTAKSLFVSDGTGGLAANELYFRNNVGTNIKVTSGNTLNVAGFAGGIGGDYTAVGASVIYDDANKRYTFKDGGANWARLQAGALRLSEFGTTAATFVQLLSPASLAVSYNLTFPGALPGSQLLEQVTSAGQVVWSNTIPGAVTFSSSVTVSGSLLHEQTWQHSIGFALPDPSASLSLGSAGTTASRLSLLTSTGDNILPLAVPIGTLTKWSVTLSKGSAAGTITARLYECNTPSGVGVTQIGATQSNSANAPGSITLGQVGLSFAMTAGREYFIVINGGGTSGDQVTSYFAAITGT